MTTSALAVAVARAALDNDGPTLCRLLAYADDPVALRRLAGDDEAVWFRDEGETVNDDDMFLPYGEELPDEPDLPLADELTPDEQYIFNNGIIHARSSWIEEWHYDGPAAVLYVLTKGSKKRNYMGTEYPCGRVPFGLVMDFYRALSPGRFFIDNIKGRFPSGGSLSYKRTSPGPNIVTKLD